MVTVPVELLEVSALTELSEFAYGNIPALTNETAQILYDFLVEHERWFTFHQWLNDVNKNVSANTNRWYTEMLVRDPHFDRSSYSLAFCLLDPFLPEFQSKY